MNVHTKRKLIDTTLYGAVAVTIGCMALSVLIAVIA